MADPDILKFDFDFAGLLEVCASAKDVAQVYAAEVLAPARAAKCANKELCDLYAELVATEKALRSDFAARYAELAEIRLALAAAGEHVEIEPLPEGLHLSIRTAVKITDRDAIPRQYMTPDIAAIKSALDNSVDLPGVELVPAYSVAVLG